ncbi:uncharacterized protein LOC102805658 [Saccoglossus kowalevskii]|uniref:Uncharacterized protein LOC102805658 n=1 Tax=Saccoglossus kowalevskii TaxID=10224 RepID=A0ABM0MGR8_SACKO|nr:PREDICTED: uncharacterized protein LOC102805658 [Saccoglossus kowalevskii]
MKRLELAVCVVFLLMKSASGIHRTIDGMWHKGGQYVIHVEKTPPYVDIRSSSGTGLEEDCAEMCYSASTCETMMFTKALGDVETCFLFDKKFSELESFFCESGGLLCSEIWVKLPTQG